MQAGTLFLFLEGAPAAGAAGYRVPKSFFKAAAVVWQKRQTTEEKSCKLGNML